MIRLKRVYESPGREDGRRFLVERLWPRGIAKKSLKIDAWLKDVAPSAALRVWFSNDPVKWDAFRERYFKELAANEAALLPIVEAASVGNVTLIYSSHDTEHNNAVALKEYLEARPGGKRSRPPPGRAA